MAGIRFNWENMIFQISLDARPPLLLGRLPILEALDIL